MHALLLKQPWVFLGIGALFVVVASIMGWVNAEAVSILQLIFGGALLIALRGVNDAVQGTLKQDVQPAIEENTFKTEQSTELTAQLVASIQSNTSMSLELDLYRRIFNIMRDRADCTACAGVIAEQLKIARTQGYKVPIEN